MESEISLVFSALASKEGCREFKSHSGHSVFTMSCPTLGLHKPNVGLLSSSVQIKGIPRAVVPILRTCVRLK